MRRLHGAGVVEGLGFGRAVLLTGRGRALRVPLSAEHLADEVARLERARDRSRAQLSVIRHRLSDGPGADLAPLFDAQVMMLDDPLLVGRALALIREERVNAEWAVQQASDEVARLFDDIDDPYLRERRGDVADVAGRLRMNLRGGARGWQDVLAQGQGPFVVVADDPPPSVAAQIDWTQVVGLAMDAGSRTSHTAILARSLGLPTIVGLRDATRQVLPGEMVAVDGTAGELLIVPTADVVAQRQRSEALRQSQGARPDAPDGGPACTRDGVCINLEANVDRLADAAAAAAVEAQGIGLFRSELLVTGGDLRELDGQGSEDAQAEIYTRLVTALTPHPVTIRTFDLDETQADPSMDAGDPARDGARHRPLGLRGIRLGLARRGMLETQIRAVLRASVHGPVRLLLPFVTTIAEVRETRAIVEQMRAARRQAGLEDPPLAVGVMIEVPAAALIADVLAGEADFVAIGTNDLIQYTLAADRTDERVAAVSDPFHPGLLRILRIATRLTARRGVPLSVCGEMASDPVLLALLVGLGITGASMTPAAIPVARRVIRAVHRGELARLARRTVTSGSLAEIEEYVARTVGAKAAASATLARG